MRKLLIILAFFTLSLSGQTGLGTFTTPTSIPVPNGGAEGTTDWINPTSGVAEFWAISTGVGSIITGGGFTGNAQRVESTGVSEVILGQNSLIAITPGVNYKLRFKHRNNFVIGDLYAVTNPGSDLFELIPINTNDAVIFESQTFSSTHSQIQIIFNIFSPVASEYFEIDEVELIDQDGGRVGLWTFQGGLTTYNDYNPDAVSLFERMSEQPDKITKQAISILIDSMQAYSIWDSLDVFYCHAINTWFNAQLNWKEDNYNATMIDTTIFYPKIGFRRSQYTGSLNSNFNPNTANGHYKLNSGSVGYYTYDNNTEIGGAVTIGCGSGGVYQSGLFGGNKEWNSWAFNSTAITALSIIPNNFIGTIQRIRNNNSSQINLFKDQTKYIRSNTSTSIPNANLYVGSLNNSGNDAFTDRKMKSFSWTGGALNDAQALKFDSFISDYINTVSTFYDYTWEDAENNYYKTHNVESLGYSLDIYAVKDNYKLAYRSDTLFFSIDGGLTYPHRRYFIDAVRFTSAVIYDNGDILFCTTENEVWTSGDNLATFTELTLENANGTPYVFHTPTNPLFPGNYYGTLQYIETFTLNSLDVAIIPSYSNIALGVCATNIYMAYGIDSIKVIYKGGVDSTYRDNGTASGSSTTGNLLGDINNTLYHRHFHSTTVSVDTIYAAAGDSYKENMWIKGVYNSAVDSFIWSKLIDGYEDATTWNRYKSVGLHAVGDTMYFASDGITTQADYGIFKQAIKDIGVLDNSIRIYNSVNKLIANYKKEGNIHYATMSKNIVYSSDNGITWIDFTTPKIPYISDGGAYIRTGIMPEDLNGWTSIYSNAHQSVTVGNNTLEHVPTIMLKIK